MSQENVDAFLRVLDALGRGDLDAWVDAFHEDGELIPLRAAIQGTYRGHDKLREFLADNAESFELFQPTYEYVGHRGDHVVALGTLRVRGKGSGAEVETPSALVVTYRNGKVVRLQDFGDKEKALAAAGLSEQDLAAT